MPKIPIESNYSLFLKHAVNEKLNEVSLPRLCLEHMSWSKNMDDNILNSEFTGYNVGWNSYELKVNIYEPHTKFWPVPSNNDSFEYFIGHENIRRNGGLIDNLSNIKNLIVQDIKYKEEKKFLFLLESMAENNGLVKSGYDHSYISDINVDNLDKIIENFNNFENFSESEFIYIILSDSFSHFLKDSVSNLANLYSDVNIKVKYVNSDFNNNLCYVVRPRSLGKVYFYEDLFVIHVKDTSGHKFVAGEAEGMVTFDTQSLAVLR